MSSQVTPIDFVQVGVLAPYLRVLRESGSPLEMLFSSCHLPREAIVCPEVWLPKSQAYMFAERASDFMRLPGLGALAGGSLQMTELGAFGSAIASAATLGEAGREARRTIGLVASGADCWIEVLGGEAWFCFKPVERFELGGAQAEQFDLAMLLNFVRLAAGSDWRPRKIRVVSCSVGMLRTIADFAEAEIVPDSETTAIGFPARMLSRVMGGVSQEPHAGATSAPQGETLSLAIRSTVEALLPHRALPNLSAMGEIFGLHPRYMQRRLAAEGSSFSEVVEGVRFQAARELLTEGALSVHEIADQLGYSGTNNFTRAFHRVAGVSPSSFRGR